MNIQRVILDLDLSGCSKITYNGLQRSLITRGETGCSSQLMKYTAFAVAPWSIKHSCPIHITLHVTLKGQELMYFQRCGFSSICCHRYQMLCAFRQDSEMGVNSHVSHIFPPQTNSSDRHGVLVVCIKIINILANRCRKKQKICKRISVGILDHAIIILTLAGVPYTLSDD